MKRCIAGLAFALMLAATASAQEYQTVAQLRESVPARWTTTIETKWRDVAIDAEIVTPDVEAIPVVKVGYDLHPSPLTPEESGWVEVNDSYETGSLILYMTDDTGKPPRKINGRKVNRDPVSKENWYGDFDPNQTYIPLSDIRFSEIQDLIRDELVKFGYPPEDFDLETPERMWLQHWYFAGTKEDAAPAEILMNLYTKLNGITVYGHILDAVRNTRGERARKDGFWDSMTTTVAYEGVIDRLSLLFISHLLPVETLAEDVPLCPFSMIQKSLEQEIKKGRVRKIYEISLGYVLYCEPGVYQEQGQEPDYSNIFYYVKPMWRVNCLKAAEAQKKLEKSDEDDERNSVAYTQMLVDAQTGEIIGQSDAADRSMFPGFLSWDDVNR